MKTYRIVNKQHQGVDLVNGKWVVVNSILNNTASCNKCGESTALVKLPDDSHMCLDCYMKRNEIVIN